MENILKKKEKENRDVCDPHIIKLQGLADGTGGIDQRCRGTDLQMASTERCLQEGDGGGTDMTRAAAAVPTLEH